MSKKVYVKAHTNEKAEKGHLKNIKKRGGKVILKQKQGEKTVISYKFEK